MHFVNTYVIQNSKRGYTLHCGPTTHPNHKTSVKEESAVSVDLY